jgi:hypothetical protein
MGWLGAVAGGIGGLAAGAAKAYGGRLANKYMGKKTVDDEEDSLVKWGMKKIMGKRKLTQKQFLEGPKRVE